jgi:hypothetical protein
MEKKKKAVKSKGPLYNTGPVAVKLYCNLLRDFRASEDAVFMNGAEYDLLTDIKTFRVRPEREMGLVSIGRFKRTKQMEALLKKFRFSTDAYTDDELSERSLNGFLEEQVRLHTPMPLKLSGIRVLQEARKIAHRILGACPGDEVIEQVQFGKKSSIGCPFALAYLDVKLSMMRAFTGTKATIKVFFDQVLPGDSILRKILKNHNFDSIKEQLDTPYLNLVEVPKTWKIYRLITPLTLIGLFFSYGLGRVFTSRLKDAGLDIAKLQQVHRKLVKQFSIDRTHATADLSCASDSITSELLNRVLPRPWYNALKKTFVRHLNVNGSIFSTASVLPMGNGATFPVETLVFYCIIKAIGNLSGTKGIYSVYGDDLIYPSRLHGYVTEVFPQLHLRLNLDKTFVSTPFRESCGSDYYRGQDVRPYFLRGDAQNLTRVRYEAFLYKVYNGLTARWDPLEIKGTLTWILSELAMLTDAIHRVPPSYPDYSGVKVSHWQDIPLSFTLLPFVPIQTSLRGGSRWFQFDFLTETPKKRVVVSTLPYYWLALQGLTDDVVDDYSNSAQDRRVWTWIHKALDLPAWSPQEPKRTSLAWQKLRKPPKIFYQNGRKVMKKLYTWQAVVASKQGAAVSTASTKTDSISDWI